MSSDLLRLWKMVGVQPDVPQRSATPLDALGLIPFVPAVRLWGYECTPLNSTTFARTGGDGVHFGFLHVDGADVDGSPVIMSTPIADEPNVIVGETFREFLALGCRKGYSSLEVLASRDGVRDFLRRQREPTELRRSALRTLRAIQQEFNLEPWPNIPERLAELQDRYLGKILWPPPLANCDEHGLQDAYPVCRHFADLAASGTFSEVIWRQPERNWFLEAWCPRCEGHLTAEGHPEPGMGYHTHCRRCFDAIRGRRSIH
jgi:hypothetical protein